MSLNDLLDQFLHINYRLNSIEETIKNEQGAIVHYQFKLNDPYTPFIYGYGDLLILDDLKFLIREKQNILKILQKQRDRLKEEFNDLLIQILLIK